MGIAGGGIGRYFGMDHYSYHHLAVEIMAEYPSETAVYYDIGNGFNEMDVVVRPIDTAGAFVTLDYCIPYKKKLRNLRFDPGSSTNRFSIRSITIIVNQTDRISVSLEAIQPANQISRPKWNGTLFEFETIETANDPFLYIGKIVALPGPPNSGNLFHSVMGSLAGMFGLFLGRWGFHYFFLGKPIGFYLNN